MKWLSFLLILALGVGALFLPAPDPPQPGPHPGSDLPPVALCAVDESSSFSTSITVGSTVDGPGLLTAFAGGATTGLAEFSTGTSGSTMIPMIDVSAVGRAAALVELPTADSAAASVMVGEGAAAGEMCSRVPEPQVLVGGGSTIDDRHFEVQLINPYAAGAVVNITATSESGREANEQLDSITVPPRTSVIVDVANLLPGREELVLLVETSRGSVVVSARSGFASDTAVWRGVAPAESWYVVLPSFGGQREVVISSGALADVEYQVDVFGPGGVEEAALEGVITPGGQAVIDVSDLSAAPVAIHVVATGPVATFVRLSSNSGLAITAGTRFEASSWLLPGAGSIPGSRGRLVLVNVGLDVTEVTVTEVRDRSRSRLMTIDSGQVIELDLSESVSDGVSLSSNGSIVPMWIMRKGPAIAISGGASLGNE